MPQYEQALKKAIRNIIYVLTLAAIAWFMYDQRDKLHLIRNISAWNVAVLFVLTYFFILCNAYIFKVTVGFFNIRLKYKHWFGITAVNTMYNYILPFKGGLALRGIYLKKNYKLKYAKYLSLIAGNFLVIFLVSAVIGSIVGTMLYLQGGISKPYYFTILAGLAATILTGLAMFFGSEYRFARETKPYRVANQMLEGLSYFKHYPVGITLVLLTQAVLVISMAYKLQIIFSALEIEASFSELIFIQALVIFSRLISITPGNIGIREGVVGLSAAILGMDGETALLAALIERIITVVFVLIFGAVYSKLLVDDIKLDEPASGDEAG